MRHACLLCLLLLAAALTGCNDSQMNNFVVELFEPKRTPEQQMVAAFAAEDPDIRRAALAKVAESKKSGADWAIDGYATIALLDNDPQARCVALRALGRNAPLRALEVTLKVLNHRDYPPSEVFPPDELTRWDATEVLANIATAGLVPEESAGRAQATLIARLRDDRNREVRIAAARGLQVFAQLETVRALIDGLADEEFAVVHRCEESLVALTGVTHHCDALAWEEWYTAHQANLFANRGEMPASRRLPYDNRFKKAAYDFRQFMDWLIPGKKEEG